MREPESDSPRLLAGAPESVAVHAQYVAAMGWCCTIGVRRQFQSWAEAAHGEYDYLTTEELVDVLTAAVSSELLG